MINNIHDNFIVKSIMPFVSNEKEHAYIVGGFVRDCLLGKQSSDVDIVVAKGCGHAYATKLAQYLEGFFVELDNVNNIYRVVFPDKTHYVDIADCTGESIQDDLKRRDFTINALAFDLFNSEIIDVVSGMQDLKNGIIREISEFNIIDDPIRILRAFRFKSQLGFEFSDDLKTILNKHAFKLDSTAKERVNVELIKLFGGEHAVETIIELDELGVLEKLIPEVVEIKKIPPNSHHHLDLFNHSLETVNQVQLFYQNSCDDVKQHLEDECFGGQKRICYLKFASFLHDVGKPATWQIEPETGRHRFIMHDSIGADVVVSTLKNLKFSKKQISYIQKIIKNHIYPAGVVTSDEVTEKARLRFFRKMEDEVNDLIAIAYADRMSALGPDITKDMLEKNINGLNVLLKQYLQEKSKLAPLPKLLDGKEIMELLGISASPELGKVIAKLKEAQITSEVNTKEEAIEFIKNIK